MPGGRANSAWPEVVKVRCQEAEPRTNIVVAIEVYPCIVRVVEPLMKVSEHLERQRWYVLRVAARVDTVPCVKKKGLEPGLRKQ